MRKAFAVFLCSAVIVLCVMSSGAIADVSVDETNFPDANFRSYVSSNCDVDSDGTLSDTEISLVTSIIVSDTGIASLKGIEHFTNLTNLGCGYNSLTSLDVSSNTALTSLNCIYSQLTSLDVSSCTELKELVCNYNQLTALDVSKNIALTRLECKGNELTELDVSQNTALISLDCGGNDLAALDVSKNTALESLICYGSELTELDVSSNTKLTNLVCYSNQLTALDVTHNTALTELVCYSNQLTALDVSKNTALTNLSCSSNQLTALDVTNNNALLILSCSDNQLTSLDLTHNTALTNLTCYSNQLTELDLSNNTALTWLDCSYNQLTALDVNANTALTDLHCTNNKLTALDVSNNTALTLLSCSSQDLSIASADSTSDSSYPYSINLNTLKTSLDVNADVSDFISRVYSLDIRDSSGSSVDHNTDSSTGIVYFAAEPSRLSYDYDVKISGDTQYMPVNVTFGASSNSGSSEESGSSSTINSTNFPHAKFRSYVLENIDTDSDGYLSDSEALAVTSINLRDYNYSSTTEGTSLAGIERFTALTYLDCNGEGLTELDVTKNTALEYLNCANNQLTELDVSHNTALKELHCYSNFLTALDVSKDVALEVLHCDSNDITELDVSQNTELTKLWCGVNPLTGLDLSNNVKLEQLFCGSSQLTSLDVSHNTNLWYLDCDYNQLSELDVSKNVALKELQCWGNQLTELDVSSNTALTWLNCSRNQLTKLDVSTNTALTELLLGYNQVTELDVSNNTALTWLWCGGNDISVLDVSNNTALETLDCGGNNLTTLDVSNNTALTGLEFGDNQLTAIDVSKNTALTWLSCYNNKLTALDVSNNTALEELRCWSNQLTALNVSNNTVLERLGCYSNDLRALVVSRNTALTHLDCCSNQLKTLDLSNNTSLIYLCCFNNQLTALDLSNNTALQRLYFNSNQLAAIDLSANTALTSFDAYGQELTLSVSPSSVSGYPYVLNMTSARSTLGLSMTIPEFVSNVYNFSISPSMTVSPDIDAGMLYLSSNPSVLSYYYYTGAPISGPTMNVTVTFGSSSSGGSTSGTSGGGSSGGYTDPYVPPTPSSPDVTPESPDIIPTSPDITVPASEDIHTVVPDNPIDVPDTPEINIGDSWENANSFSTAEALLGLLSRINDGTEPSGRYYVIEADINLSGQNWTGIGTEEHPFSGHFGGNGHTITCPASGGLFGLIDSEGVAVRELAVRTASTSSSGQSDFTASASTSQCVGGIAQELLGGTIEDCTFSGTLTAEGEDSSAGGIVGELSGGTVRKCRVLRGSRINAKHSAGGIAGYVSGGEITECSSSATLDAEYSGGIAGYSETERNSINGNSFTEADYEVGNDASRLTLTPETQEVQEGSAITAITFSAQGISSWSFVSDLAGLVSSDNSITGEIPYDTPAGAYTVQVNAITTDGTRISGQATINVTQVEGSRNFMYYIFDIPAALRNGIASFFGVDEIYQFSAQEIVSENWQLDRADLQEITGKNLRVILNLPEVRPLRSGVYLLKLTMLDLSVGTALGIQGITGSSQVSSSALEDVEYALFDENGREITGVPTGKVVYVALRLNAGRTHRSVVTAPKELGLGTIQPFFPDDELMAKIAETVNISADKLNLLGDENIGDPLDPTQAMLDEMASRESDPVGKMNSLIVSRDGYYVLKVVLSDDLYEQHIKGVKAENLKAYVIHDDGEAESSEVSASFITGLLNTWELLSLNGEKLEFGAKEFLMVGFLNAGTPFSVYLTKLLIALLLGGCDAGFGLAGLGVLAVGTILLMRRKR